MSILKYVNNIALAEVVSRKKINNANDQCIINWGGKSAIINAGAMNIFDGKLSVLNKQDTSNSLLFAQLAANKEWNRYTDSREWFAFFTDVLNNIGWSGVSATSHTSSGDHIQWEDLVLNTMEAYADEDELALAQLGMSSWQNLPTDSKAMNIWETNTIENQYQNFQVIPGVFNQKTGVNIVLSGIHSSARKDFDGFLSFNNFYSIQEQVERMILNESVYAQVREAIIEKLGDRIDQCMANLPLKT